MRNAMTLHQAKTQATLDEIKRSLLEGNDFRTISLSYEGECYKRDIYCAPEGIIKFKGWEKIGENHVY